MLAFFKVSNPGWGMKWRDYPVLELGISSLFGNLRFLISGKFFYWKLSFICVGGGVRCGEVEVYFSSFRKVANYSILEKRFIWDSIGICGSDISLYSQSSLSCEV